MSQPEYLKRLILDLRIEAAKRGYVPPGSKARSSVLPTRRGHVVYPKESRVETASETPKNNKKKLRETAPDVMAYDKTADHYPETIDIEVVDSDDEHVEWETSKGDCALCSVRKMREGKQVWLHRGQSTQYCETCGVYLCCGGGVGRNCFAEWHRWRAKHPRVVKRNVWKKACGRSGCSYCPGRGEYPEDFNQETGFLKNQV